jgi:hypothetical protein
MERVPTRITAKILDVVKTNPGCGLDDLIESLPGVQWSDVFIEVDRLSRSGELRVTKPKVGFLLKLHPV